MLAASRATLRANLSSQNARRVFGVVAFLHPGCRCQKQPWTKITLLMDGMQMSGVPGNDFR
jgi:hypothetical protein